MEKFIAVKFVRKIVQTKHAIANHVIAKKLFKHFNAIIKLPVYTRLIIESR
ncbi:hypothetical protein HMPREF9372_3697 [Sporosarcina newyorkensis 2681]|uniref:Uncharacterized protein n=1 Tax=Sporosarcina newyorkensis 2681 TaxID=1027292 RepID=F9DY16_9BACL|nr:hypothetical protein HMPREF9372_3697 [Sporosarcina newyorkensis 2681]